MTEKQPAKNRPEAGFLKHFHAGSARTPPKNKYDLEAFSQSYVQSEKAKQTFKNAPLAMGLKNVCYSEETNFPHD